MSYTVVASSIHRLPDSPSIGNALYNIDWSFMEDGCDYKVTFTFVSKQEGQTNDLIMNQVYLLTCPNLGNRNCYQAGKTTTTQSSSEIGIIRPYAIKGSVNEFFGLSASVTDNPYFIIKGRPSSSPFQVQIYELDKATINNLVAEYVLLLHFEKVHH